MALLTLLTAYLAAAACGLASGAADPLVTLEQGALRGKTVTSRLGRDFLAFQGIPYAAPPVGDLRFKAPQEAAGWSDERQAHSDGASCLQVEWLYKSPVIGQEDCLYLNVYTPRLEREGAGLSVMVWVHGGGFNSGSGSFNKVGPKYLLDHDVILVSFNYRLGVLGFLSLGTTEAPGNYGLKDQVAVLQWVKKNIAKFGGNPDSVTIFGESAGGTSVHYLMLSPLARGLFHRAIAQSGSAYNRWAVSKDAAGESHALAARFGCEDQDASALLTCLRSVEAARFLEPNLAQVESRKKRRAFVPTIEPPGTEGAFLTEDPRSMLARGDISDVPFMAGLMTHEGIMHLGMLQMLNRTVEEDLRTEFSRYMEELSLVEGTPQYLNAWRDILAFFQTDVPGDATEQFVLLNSDTTFNIGVDEMMRGVAALRRSPVFYYQFSYDGGLGYLKRVMRIQYNGTIHTDELGYLFSGSDYPDLQTASPADLLTIERITSLWTNFATTSNPTPDSKLGVSWNFVEGPLNEPKMAATCYLDIGAQLVMTHRNLNAERVAFWQRLRETYQAPARSEQHA